MMKLKSVQSAALGMAVCTVFALTARADDAAPTPAKAPVPVARVAVGSANQLSGLADDLGVPLPAMLTPAGVEQMFSFLGQGSLNPDLPLAFDILAGKAELTQEQRGIFYLPIIAGRVPLKDLLANGDKMGDDGVLLNNMPFRRTGDYLLFGGTPDAMAGIKPDEMLKSMSDRPLFYVEYDAKALHQAEPALIEKFKKNVRENSAKPASQAEGQGEEWAIHTMADGFDKLIFRLDKKNDALRLAAQIQPFPEVATRAWTLQGLPGAMAARLDFQMPAGSVKPALDQLRKMVGDEDFFKDSDADTPAEREQFVAAMSDAIEVVLFGQQTTYGLGSDQDRPVLFIVSQSTAPRKGHEDWARIVEELKPFTNKHGKKDNMRLSQHDSTTGQRVDELEMDDDDGKLQVVIDSVDRDGVRFTTMESQKNTAIDKLLQARPDGGTLKQLAAGWVDPGEALKMSAKAMPQLTDADHALLDKVLAGQKIGWTVSTERNQLDISMELPMSILKNIVANGAELGELAGRLNTK